MAVRIVECLRKRSIAAEYDDDSALAIAITVDRVHFTIQLYRGSKSQTPSSAVFVECQRQSGSVTSFHVACHAILQAAKGVDTGIDNRIRRRTNAMEFQSLSPIAKRRKLSPSSFSFSSPRTISTISSPFIAAEAAFEAARELLHKDRFECQQLGMEQLVNLTSCDISGYDMSHHVSQRIIQDDWLIESFLLHPEAKEAVATARSNNTNPPRSQNCMKAASHSEEIDVTTLIRSFLESSAAVTPSHRMSLYESDDQSADEIRHEARLRSLALRVLCNALYNVSQSGELQSVLTLISPSSSKRKGAGSSRLVQLLLSLVQDMQGMNRPPSIVKETGLSSVHEATLAVRCLRLLAGSSKDTSSSPQTFVRSFLRNQVILESLEHARSCGRSTHSVLQKEAERTYTQLTEDVRSC